MRRRPLAVLVGLLLSLVVMLAAEANDNIDLESSDVGAQPGLP